MLPPLEQEDRDLEGAAGGQEGGAGPDVVQVVVERVLGRDELVLAGEVQSDHGREGVEARTDHHSEGVEHRSAHHRCGGAEQHAQRVDAVEQAEGQRDAGGPVDQVVAERLAGRTGPVHEAREAHLERDPVRPALVGLPPIGVVAALAAAGVVSLDGALGPVGAALRVFGRLVLEGRLDARDVHQVGAGVEHELRGRRRRVASAGEVRAVVGAMERLVLAVRQVAELDRVVLDHRGQLPAADGEGVTDLEVAVLVGARLLQLRGNADAELVDDALQPAAATVAVVAEASGGHVGVRDVGHVIALSVWGLSTKRIERTARGKQSRLFAWCSTLVNSFSKCITPRAKNNAYIIPLKLIKVNIFTSCIMVV